MTDVKKKISFDVSMEDYLKLRSLTIRRKTSMTAVASGLIKEYIAREWQQGGSK